MPGLAETTDRVTAVSAHLAIHRARQTPSRLAASRATLYSRTRDGRRGRGRRAGHEGINRAPRTAQSKHSQRHRRDSVSDQRPRRAPSARVSNGDMSCPAWPPLSEMARAPPSTSATAHLELPSRALGGRMHRSSAARRHVPPTCPNSRPSAPRRSSPRLVARWRRAVQREHAAMPPWPCRLGRAATAVPPRPKPTPSSRADRTRLRADRARARGGGRRR